MKEPAGTPGECLRERILGRRIELNLIWKEGRLAELDVDWIAPGEREKPGTALGARLRRSLLALEAGKRPDWPRLPLAWDCLPEGTFRATVLHVLQERVHYGDLITYGALAALAGHPGAARAVGTVMAGSPWGLVVPCHRVLAAGGRLGGFGGHVALKAYLLRCEGYTVLGEEPSSRVLLA